jgi:CBS domain-containing protein
LTYVLPFMFACQKSHDICTQHPDRCLRFACSPTHYNSLATLFFTPPNEAIRALFDRSTDPEAQIVWSVLLVFCITYFVLCCLSYNMAVPGGLFIPSIIIGGSYGRLIGIAMQSIITPPTTDPDLGINPGVYAVLGAASMLGGITRMTLPISVMMIEITSDAQFLIPIMLVVLLAKAIADRLIGGLYAEHLRMDGLIMVFGDKLPRKLKTLTAKEIMSEPPLIKLSVVDTVRNAYMATTETKHHAFPVIDSDLASIHKVSRKRNRDHREAYKRPNPTHVSQLPRNATVDNTSYDSMNNINGTHSGTNTDDLHHNSSSSSTTNTRSPSSPTRGIFLGLVQRRHLNYLLTNRPCYSSAIIARDAEPLTTTLFDLQPILSSNSDATNPTSTFSSSSSAAVTQSNRQISAPPPVLHDMIPESPDSAAELRGEADSNSRLDRSSTNVHYRPSLTAVGANPRMDQAPLLTGSRFQSATHSLDVQDNLMSNYVNLAPFIDTGAYIVTEETSSRRIWNLFKKIGMRHIVVVNQHHQPVGMITRHDLMHFAVN